MGKGVSLVIPCLDEEETIEAAIRSASQALSSLGCTYEIIVADNGSRDQSVELAQKNGARVVHVDQRGYGAAVHSGLQGAKFDFLIFADADLSYPFEEVPRFVEKLEEGYDLVLGNRLRRIQSTDAMPFLNRYLGTPVLSALIRIIYGMPVHDCNSGMRALNRASFLQLDLRSPGMEYASEMLIQSALSKHRYTEIDIGFRKDQRSRPPHLNRWRDGVRHLKTIVSGAVY